MSKIWNTHSYSTKYYITHPWEYIAEIIRSVKWDIQRSRRGWADCDVWNMDDYLLKILPEMLNYLADNTNSYVNGITFEEWQDTLREMARLFNNICDGNKSSQEHEEFCNTAFDMLKKHFFDLWD